MDIQVLFVCKKCFPELHCIIFNILYHFAMNLSFLHVYTCSCIFAGAVWQGKCSFLFALVIWFEPTTVRRTDLCWVPSSAPFSQVTCSCQTNGFVLCALICTFLASHLQLSDEWIVLGTVISTFLASHLQLSDERIRAGCPHQHLSGNF